jgi:hypothetical protein
MGIHLFVRGQQLGPFPPEEIRNRLARGELQLNDLAWTDGLADWVPLSSLPGFSPIPAPPPLNAPIPLQTRYVPPQFQYQPQPSPASRPTSTSGLAIASLVCGILSLVILPIISSLPAIICGHLARSQVKTSGGTIGGAGIALAGLIMGYLGFFCIGLIVFAGIALPVFGEVQLKEKETHALANGKQIATGCKLYAVDHQGAFPDRLEQLVPEYVPTPEIFASPLTPSEPIGFDYFGGRDTDPPDQILLITKTSDSRHRRVIITLSTAGRVVKDSEVPPLPPPK